MFVFCDTTVAPSSITLTLDSTSEPAAIGDTTALTSDTDVDGLDLTVIDGMTYNFKATTDNVDPPPEFDWERRAASAYSDGDILQDGTRPSQTASNVRCPATPAENNLVEYNVVNYNTDNDKFIYVSADNDHPNHSVGQFVKLNVQGKSILLHSNNYNNNHVRLPKVFEIILTLHSLTSPLT